MPKPMVPILGSPLLEHQFALCRQHGFLRILLLVHHAHEQIRAHFGDGSAFGVSLGYALETRPRGTAGALHDALPHLLDTFLVRSLLVPALSYDLGRVIWWPSRLWRSGPAEPTRREAAELVELPEGEAAETEHREPVHRA